MARRMIGLAVGALGAVLVLPPPSAAAEEPLPDPGALDCRGQFFAFVAQQAGPRGTTDEYGYAPGVGNISRVVFPPDVHGKSVRVTHAVITENYCSAPGPT